MADLLNTTLDLNLLAGLSDTLLASISASLGERVQLSLADGTGANQAHVVYSKQRTITNSGTPDVLNLSDGSLISKGGSAVFSKVKIILITNQSAAQILTVGGGTNPINLGSSTNTFTVGKSGIELKSNPVDGFTVTASSADRITVNTDGGTNVPYNIHIIG